MDHLDLIALCQLAEANLTMTKALLTRCQAYLKSLPPAPAPTAPPAPSEGQSTS